MKIIVPMAGRGSRLRPHTLTVPKPLVPIAGMPIVHRLVQDIAGVLNTDIEEIAFVIGPDFGQQVEDDLHKIAAELGAANSRIFYQHEPLGTGHAIMMAADALEGPCVVAYADTLFTADFTLDADADAVIWVKQVDKPEAYGVVQLNDEGRITDFVEKPTEFVSDLAIIGIYYFKSGERLRKELQHLMDNNITKGGEYQLTDALESMKVAGLRFMPGTVDQWMDCGNKDIALDTNHRMLDILATRKDPLVTTAPAHASEDVAIIEPCIIGEGTVILNSSIGPHVTIGSNCVIENSSLRNCLIQNDTHISNADLQDSMIGNKVRYDGNFTSVSLGDYTTLD